MGKKALANMHCLLDLIERAPVSALERFASLDECLGLFRGFEWPPDDQNVSAALIERIRSSRKDLCDAAEREALRILRLASERGAAILSTTAQQLRDDGLVCELAAQGGGEVGRAIWMRTRSDATTRLFEVAESILNTGDLRGNKRLYDAFDVPCGDAPPFIWNESIRRELEAQFTTALRLSEPCDIIYVPINEEGRAGSSITQHYLVVRFAGEQVAAVQVVNRSRRSFYYFPARDATLVYVPSRKMVEVYAHTLSTRAPLANVLSQHGFKLPLSSRPLNRSRYDLSPFAQSLDGVTLVLDGARVERLYLAEATALLGHEADAVTLHIDSGKELHEVIGGRWSTHPFAQPGAIIGVTLVALLIFDGETTETPLSIVLAEPGRCSLQGERDQRLRRAGTQLLEKLRVLKPLHPVGIDDPALMIQVSRLLEYANHSMDGFTLAQLGIDIERFADEGIITAGERISEKFVELADDGERQLVKLERCADPDWVRYCDPLTGNDVMLPATHARRWKVHQGWLREEIISTLGTALQGVRARSFDEEPVFFGEIEIDGYQVPLYFATRMSLDRQYARIDAALRQRPRAVPGIVLTTSSIPCPYAGTNVVISIEDVLAAGGPSIIDVARLKVVYRHGQLAAMGGSNVSLKISPDGYTAVLYIPGKAPWRVTGNHRIVVLQRLIDAYAAGAPHVSTKRLMDGTGYQSPGNLFPGALWREYLVRVEGAYAWQLNLPMLDEVAAGDIEVGTTVD